MKRMKRLFITIFSLTLALGCEKVADIDIVAPPPPPPKPKAENPEPKPEAKTKAPEPKPEAKKPGTVLWEFATGGWVLSSPSIGTDGTIYVGSWGKKIFALDGQTGAKKWEYVTGDFVYSSPAIRTDDTIYIG